MLEHDKWIWHVWFNGGPRFKSAGFKTYSGYLISHGQLIGIRKQGKSDSIDNCVYDYNLLPDDMKTKQFKNISKRVDEAVQLGAVLIPPDIDFIKSFKVKRWK